MCSPHEGQGSSGEIAELPLSLGVIAASAIREVPLWGQFVSLCAPRLINRAGWNRSQVGFSTKKCSFIKIKVFPGKERILTKFFERNASEQITLTLLLYFSQR